MALLSRPPSRELPIPLTRSLSIEETYHLADTARRKSLSEATRNDLRLRLAHSHVLGHLLLDIAAQTEAQSLSSPLQPTTTSKSASSKHISWAPQEVSKTSRYSASVEFDEYDDGEEDLGSLSLVRTPSRRP